MDLYVHPVPHISLWRSGQLIKHKVNFTFYFYFRFKLVNSVKELSFSSSCMYIRQLDILHMQTFTKYLGSFTDRLKTIKHT
jgi:hypothetical protein